MPDSLASRISWLLTYAEQHGMDLYEVAGQILFPVYAQSGGLATSYICYFKRKSDQWPLRSDLGRERNSAIGVVSVEFEHGWNVNEWTAHLESHFGPDDKAVSA